MGRVRCPDCVPARRRLLPARDLKAMLTASENRRVERAILSLTLNQEQFSFSQIPFALLSTDRILLRWGSEGSGMPSENPDAYRDSLPVPLDPKTFAVVNDIVREAPKRVRFFVGTWYAGSNPTYTLERRGFSRKGIARARTDCLHAMKARFQASHHADLVALVRFITE
jgi:hypothetical protein